MLEIGVCDLHSCAHKAETANTNYKARVGCQDTALHNKERKRKDAKVLYIMQKCNAVALAR